MPKAIAGLGGLHAALQVMRSLAGELTLREAEVLLLIAESPGRTQTEICQSMEISNAAAYRLVVDGLALRLGLVRQEKGSADEESRGFFLTKKGETFLTRVAGAISAEGGCRDA